MKEFSVDSGKYFVRYHNIDTDINRLKAREMLEDELNEVANHEDAILISTNLMANSSPMLLISVWLWEQDNAPPSEE